MKGLLLITGYCILLSWSMSGTRPKQENSDTITLSTPDSIYFRSQVVPLLQKKCSPCHFEGGKMFVKMPFDQASTLINHQAGILKRFNEENEKPLLKKFLQESKTSK